MLVLQTGEIYELRQWDGLKCLHFRTKLYKYRFSHLKFNMGDTLTNTETHIESKTISQAYFNFSK
jgi:hypothetical protein